MAANISMSPEMSSLRAVNYRVIIVQVLVILFLSVNFFLISTFFRKDTFYSTMRYILFALTLMSDCLFLIMTNSLLIMSYFGLTIQVWSCYFLYIIISVYAFVTPLTLTAMTLERYVAICLPLRHAELCSSRAALHLILIIHSIGSVPCTVTLSIFSAAIPPSFYNQPRLCSVEMFVLTSWQSYVRSAIGQFYFFLMCAIIVFSYVQIMKAARAASGESKKSTWKGLRTVVLHSFQLLLCLIQLWCPFIEAAILKIDFNLFVNVRYFNYIIFSLASRCLSPLIYGLRDELFFQALKSYFLCRFQKRIMIL